MRAWVKRERLRFEIQYRHGQTMHDLRAELIVELAEFELVDSGGVT